MSAPVRHPVIALVGNPNAGKTSLFNALTGARQRTGNYPGVTVERVSGTAQWEGQDYEIIDVPGLYSLSPVSLDEQLALQSLAQDPGADVVVAVIDGSNLERNLFLFSQLAEWRLNLVVAVTMTDLLERDETQLDLEVLRRNLDCPVVAVVPHKEEGLADLCRAVESAITSPSSPALHLGYPEIVESAVDRLLERGEPGWERGTLRRILLLGDAGPGHPEPSAALAASIESERAALVGPTGQGRQIDAQARYAWAAHVRKQALQPGSTVARWTERIDKVLTHRVFGLVFFLGLMWGVFQSIYTLAGPLMDGIEAVKLATQQLASAPLAGTPVLRSLVVEGIIEGFFAAVIFLPQIAILFFWIAVLEGTGYLARAAFLMDRLLGWCGLSGRAFIPLLSSFACAIPGIMAARVMPDHKSRLLTVLVAPLMSCSARLPVYVLMIGVVIEPMYGPAWAGFALFAMHFVGLAVAVPLVWALNRKVVKGRRLPFMLELPRYQRPKWRDVAVTIVSRVKVFLQTAGTIIVAMSVVIWALLAFPQGDDARYAREFAAQPSAYTETHTLEQFQQMRQREESILGRFGKAIEPAFAPAGFDWRLTTAVLAAFPAREVVVPAMGILFSEGGDVDEESEGLRATLAKATWPDGRPLITPWTAVSLMVFFALCCQCMATLAAMRRETGSWKWPLFAFVTMTGLAYVCAVAIYQLGRWIG